MDRRVRKTRERLFEALIGLLKEKNFERITLQEIAERADVNRGTVYLHFEDKFDLLNRCIETYLQQLNDSCRPASAAEAPEVSMLRTFEYLESRFEIYSVLLRGDSLPAFRVRLSELLRQGVEEQFDRSVRDERVNREIAVQFVTTAMAGLLEWWIVRSMPYPADEMVRQLAILLQDHGLYGSGEPAQQTSPAAEPR
ncbi:MULTISPECIES: TetR/AcrR family transcriptional regulator [Saccharibacillus]|uniref:TetR/AcrR family transcriptional regulator n=1 Tax=Saccharibacillus TaxID=456492 RepID=UPI00123C4BD6|nr:TetR/AcrR family transcriptional regulator C-terminal domain-containing protein [Saccharibacillus sp. WB 17]MWJ30376.1 TetR family transcriptional regulator [Saccharibacillus sp. WB 17]